MRSENGLRWDGKRKGFYEVYFLKGNEPQGGLAFWLRYTLRAPCEGEAVAELWAVVFGREGATAVKSGLPAREASWDARPFALRIGAARLADGAATGRVEGKEGTVEWDLRWEPPPRALRPLPGLLYRTPFPTTKFLSPGWDVAFTGTIAVGGRVHRLDPGACRGQQSHLWGTRHAERWAWAHCNMFDGTQERGAFEALSAVARPGMPPLTLLCLRLGETEVMLNGWRALARNGSCHTLDRWVFHGEAGGLRLEGAIDADRARMVGVGYLDPDGSPLVCHNTKTADLRLAVMRRDGAAWRVERELSASGTCAYEAVERQGFLPVRI